MTNIKASRKGTRLNDIRYFRLPLSHTRKRMTIIRVMPRIVNPELDLFHTVQDSMDLHPAFGIGTKPRLRDKTVESKQSSVEMAFMTCRGFEQTDDQSKKQKIIIVMKLSLSLSVFNKPESFTKIRRDAQDICVETEIIMPSSNPPSLTQQEDIATIISEDSKKSVKLAQIEDDREEPVENMASEKSLDQTERSCENVDRKQNCGDRVIETAQQEKCGNWWKDSGQTILQFFAKILGRRAGMTAKGPADRVLPTGKRVKRVSRDGRSYKRHRRGIDGGIRLRRVSNGYIATHACRRGQNRRGSIAAENKSREDSQAQQQHRPSILVRQIQRTRDKNLRIVLLERELRARLPNIAKKDIRPIASAAANLRQLSSPLC